MRRRTVLVVVAGLLLAVGALEATLRLTTVGDLDHGTVVTRSAGPITVRPGQLFSIEVPANRVSGDHWDLAEAAPDQATVRATGQEYVRNLHVTSLLPALIGDSGPGGRYYFVFRAGSPGRTTISLHNTYRAGMAPTTGLAPEQLDRSFTVEVG